MSWHKIKLEILTPEKIVVSESVDKVIAEGGNGHFCLLPRHIDYLSDLVPGILTYWKGTEEHFLAVDEGFLVKYGERVYVSVFKAIAGGELEELETVVHERFRKLDKREEEIRIALNQLEADFLRRFVEMEKRLESYHR